MWRFPESFAEKVPLITRLKTPWEYSVVEPLEKDQLLFLVVKLERPDLARIKSELIQQQWPGWCNKSA